jgi:hypothetical protein
MPVPKISHMIPPVREPGISFVIRNRNEEKFLGLTLQCLKLITVPHEILVINHLCTDTSKAVAEKARDEGQPIRIFEYDHPISRAGYETFITPPEHPGSFVKYTTWCFSKATKNWIFKWDVDFIASPELITFLNTELKLDERSPIRYHIPCEMTSQITNSENYLYNCLAGFKKYIFWEVPMFYGNAQMLHISHKIHTIPPTVLKPYWMAPPWFIGKDADLTEKYKKLVEICGPEPIGAARGSNKECEISWANVHRHRSTLEALGYKWIE